MRKKSIDILCVLSLENFSVIVLCCDLEYHFFSTFIRDVATERRLRVITCFSFAELRIYTRIELSVQLIFTAANKI